MTIKREIRHQIDRYLAEQSTLGELRLWLAEHTQDAYDGPPRVQTLADRLWVLLSEYDLGHRTEDSIREELRLLLVPA